MFNSILSDHGIERLIDEGVLGVEPRPETIQPASFDVRFGMTLVWDEQAQAEEARRHNKGSHVLDPESTAELARPFIEDDEIIIPPGSHVEVFPKERLSFDREVLFPWWDLRSTYGRLGLRPYHYFLDYSGRPYFSLRNMNPNTLRVPNGDRFAQLFFSFVKTPKDFAQYEGHPVLSVEDAKRIAEQVIEGDVEFYKNCVVFHAGDRMRRFKEVGEIFKGTEYEDDELYFTYTLDDPVRLRPGQCAVVSALERVRLSRNVGLLLLHQPPLSQPVSTFDIVLNRVNAGWVDPGYEGRVTLHPHDEFRGIAIERGKPVAFGLFFHFENPVGRAYGDARLNSQYQNSDGVGFRT